MSYSHLYKKKRESLLPINSQRGFWESYSPKEISDTPIPVHKKPSYSSPESHLKRLHPSVKRKVFRIADETFKKAMEIIPLIPKAAAFSYKYDGDLARGVTSDIERMRDFFRVCKDIAPDDYYHFYVMQRLRQMISAKLPHISKEDRAIAMF